jgi:DNA polymerase-1
LQNIPVKTDFGRVLRKIFISEENSYLLSADYSQIELRILAHFSLDKRLVEWFQKDKDVHTHTACMIFNTEKENIDKKMRDLAKTVNFGIVYGISPFGLAKQLDMPVEEAGSFIDKYFDIYPQVKEYINRQSRKIKESDYVKTILGRKRYVGRLSGQNISKKGLSRIILNAPIQGSAADIIKLAMIRINDKLESLKLKSYIILQIHDELILNVYENEYEVLNIVKKETEQAFSLKVPLKIDLKKGKNWFNMESIKL